MSYLLCLSCFIFFVAGLDISEGGANKGGKCINNGQNLAASYHVKENVGWLVNPIALRVFNQTDDRPDRPHFYSKLGLAHNIEAEDEEKAASIGSVVQTFWTLHPEFCWSDGDAQIARGLASIFTLGNVFTVYDCNDDKLGIIQEAVGSSLGSFFLHCAPSPLLVHPSPLRFTSVRVRVRSIPNCASVSIKAQIVT